MKRIGLISDTHGYFDPKLKVFFSACDEIWHAGDIGNLETADEISDFKPFIAVHGNIDDTRVRSAFPLHQRFMCEDVSVWITHIGGYPGSYNRSIRKEMEHFPPALFISGHSHILKIMRDKKLNLLHINPGSAGIQGFHRVRTAVRFTINGHNIENLEVWELSR